MVLHARAGIGRDSTNEIQIVDDPLVSREHAVLVVGKEGIVRIEDRFSRNGTRVNGEVVWTHSLRHGDRLDIGGSAFVYRELTDVELEGQNQASILHIASGPAQDLTATRDPSRPPPAKPRP
jgi:pSer/pThr/pTyr-binding forkhead associated (FHA) protein